MVQDQIWPHWLCQLLAKRDQRRKEKGRTTASAVSGRRRTEIHKGKSGGGQKG